MNSPTKEEIKSLREKNSLSKEEAAAYIYKALRSWQQYERGDRKMDPAFWELFKMKCSKLKTK